MIPAEEFIELLVMEWRNSSSPKPLQEYLGCNDSEWKKLLINQEMYLETSHFKERYLNFLREKGFL